MITHDQEDLMFEKLQLRELIQELPDKPRVVVSMISAGHTQADCAKIVGLTRAAVGVIYHKAVDSIGVSLRGADATP
ncbi:hypothetical protein KAR91_24860 [Candidatus Pacearchaeota archaeon]|nr:hypothetical protein [Candidatus Pacearchaeota archaeon]